MLTIDYNKLNSNLRHALGRTTYPTKRDNASVKIEVTNMPSAVSTSFLAFKGDVNIEIQNRIINKIQQINKGETT